MKWQSINRTFTTSEIIVAPESLSNACYAKCYKYYECMYFVCEQLSGLNLAHKIYIGDTSMMQLV